MYSLNHENIVSLYNHFEDDHHCYLIMEFSPGGTLYEKLKRSESGRLVSFNKIYNINYKNNKK